MANTKKRSSSPKAKGASTAAADAASSGNAEPGTAGRAAAEIASRPRALALGVLSLGAVAGAVFGLLRLGRSRYVSGAPLAPGAQPDAAPTPAEGPQAAREAATTGTGAEHVPSDLMGDAHPDGSDRAPAAFRPDPTAPVPEAERDALRPALAGAQAPTLVKGQATELERPGAIPS